MSNADTVASAGPDPAERSAKGAAERATAQHAESARRWCRCDGFHAEDCEGFEINDPARTVAARRAESVRLRLGYMRWVGLLFRWYIADEDGVSQDVALTRRAALRRAKGRAVRQFDGTGGGDAG